MPQRLQSPPSWDPRRSARARSRERRCRGDRNGRSTNAGAAVGGSSRGQRPLALADRSDDQRQGVRVHDGDRPVRDRGGVPPHPGSPVPGLHPSLGGPLRSRGRQRRSRRRCGRAQPGPDPAGKPGALPVRGDGRREIREGRALASEPVRHLPPELRRRLLAQAEVPERDVAGRDLHGRAVPGSLREDVCGTRVLFRHCRGADAARRREDAGRGRPLPARLGRGQERVLGRPGDGHLAGGLGPRDGLVRDGARRHPRRAPRGAPGARGAPSPPARGGGRGRTAPRTRRPASGTRSWTRAIDPGTSSRPPGARCSSTRSSAAPTTVSWDPARPRWPAGAGAASRAGSARMPRVGPSSRAPWKGRASKRT